jgi:glycosyltransferase involved in cell wall biosynthesis
LPIISVIIPTFNRATRLSACLESLTRQQLPREEFEVIVVDDGGNADLRVIIEPLRALINIRLLKQGNSGPAAARNYGAANATGQFIAFTDDDCTPDGDWLTAFMHRLQQDPSRLYGGHTVNALDGNVYSAASQALIDYLYDYFNADPEQGNFFTSNNMALSRSMFEMTGGFDTDFSQAGGEDRELCDRWLQLGYSMSFVPEARVRHAHEMDLRSFWKQHFSYGAGAWRYWECKHERGLEGPKLEPPSFYLRLVNHARKNKLRHPLRLTLLLVLSQVANAAGFASARSKGTQPRTNPSGTAGDPPSLAG